MPVVRCPDCGKVISLRWTIHNCKTALTNAQFEAIQPLTKAVNIRNRFKSESQHIIVTNYYVASNL